MTQIRSAYKILFGKLEGKKFLERRKAPWLCSFKTYVNEIGSELDSSMLTVGFPDSCERGIKPSRFHTKSYLLL